MLLGQGGRHTAPLGWGCAPGNHQDGLRRMLRVPGDARGPRRLPAPVLGLSPPAWAAPSLLPGASSRDVLSTCRLIGIRLLPSPALISSLPLLPAASPTCLPPPAADGSLPGTRRWQVSSVTAQHPFSEGASLPSSLFHNHHKAIPVSFPQCTPARQQRGDEQC